VLALTGAAIAPAFVVAYVLTDRLVDDSVRTEANTWVATAANVGGAVGVAVAGLLIETSSPQTSFAVGGGLLILTLPMLFLTRGQPLRVP
jgi:predicted MFS family arabinose efflux permease